MEDFKTVLLVVEVPADNSSEECLSNVQSLPPSEEIELCNEE